MTYEALPEIPRSRPVVPSRLDKMVVKADDAASMKRCQSGTRPLKDF